MPAGVRAQVSVFSVHAHRLQEALGDPWGDGQSLLLNCHMVHTWCLGLGPALWPLTSARSSSAQRVAGGGLGPDIQFADSA